MAVYNEYKKVKSIYYGSQVVYKDSVIITYQVEPNDFYYEEISTGESILNPTTFTASKSGYTFLGWKYDKTTDSVILENITATEPVTLYAVFSKEITLSYNGNDSTSGSVSSQSGTIYYNNENKSTITFALKSNGFTKSGYTFSKWAADSISGTQYSAGSSITISDSKTMYAVWKRNAVTNQVLASGAKGTVNAAGTTGTVYFDTTGFSSIKVTLSVTSDYGYGWLSNIKTDFSGEGYHIGGSGTKTKTISLTGNSGSQPISYKICYDGGYGGNSSNTVWKVTVTAS